MSTKSYFSSVLVALSTFAVAGMFAPAHADRIILTPSPTALLANTYHVEGMQQLGPNPQSSLWTAAGTTYTEVELAAFHRPERDAAAISLTTQILPETSDLPAIAVGVRDITDATSRMAGQGYRGRAFYFSAGRSPIKFADSPYPLRNLTCSLGLGGGGIRGFFGSVAGDLPLKVRWTVEWDSRMFNERLAMPLNASTQVEVTRIGKSTMLGVEYHTPMNVF
ncbi:MAG TPA: hypothetical protein VGK19_21380 [Capsulimonadaceae bacterium]|jgi:hypothetical protein